MRMLRTLPNALTLLRILLAPAAGALIVLGGPEAGLPAFGLFCAAAVTDFLDGRLARGLGQESALGRMLDPIADKIMTTLALAALTSWQANQTWSFIAPAFAILMREVLVAGLREFLAQSRNGETLAVTRAAKWKTAAQSVAIAGMLLGGTVPALSPAALALLWVAAGLTAFTGWDYFRKATASLGIRGNDRGEGT